MAKLFALCKYTSNGPDIDTSVTPVSGWVQCGQVNREIGAWIISGTQAQLAAVAALPTVTAIVTATEAKPVAIEAPKEEPIEEPIENPIDGKGGVVDGGIDPEPVIDPKPVIEPKPIDVKERWAELDAAIPATARTALNLAIKATPKVSYTIPVGVTYKDAVVALFRKVNPAFDLAAFDVQDSEAD